MFLVRSNYNRSNRITKIKFKVSSRAVELASKIMDSKSTEDRQVFCLDLCDELCDLAGIAICNIEISDKHQHHKKTKGRVTMRQYGFYRPASKQIFINNRTAVRGQVLAGKTFLNTVLHEWMHHYDFCKLKINSIHTKGFYLRLKSLEDSLRR